MHNPPMHRTVPAVLFPSVERGSAPARPVIGPTLSGTGVMSETDTQLLQQIVDLLRESAEYRRKSIGEAVDSLRNQPDDWKKNREESMRRMAEATARSEERRREDQQHQAAVLAELKTITSLLQELLRRSGGAG